MPGILLKEINNLRMEGRITLTSVFGNRKYQYKVANKCGQNFSK